MYFCTKCHHEGNAKTIISGSTFAEILLWCFYIFPGLCYSIWRRAHATKDVCENCGADKEAYLVPKDCQRAIEMKEAL